MKNVLFMVVTVSILVGTSYSQKNTGKFELKTPGYFEEVIKKNIDDFETKTTEDKKSFKINLEGLDLPKDKAEFTSYWHNDPISQGNTGTCWSFSTTSFFESEVFRIHNKKVKLSELYTVYWEYVEKAIGFVETRGSSLFAEGSEANAVTKIWKKYGVVPGNTYTGMLPEQKFHNHSVMFNEMETYLKSVKTNSAWNVELVVSTIKSILNKYLGIPPSEVIIEGKTYTPLEYLNNYIKINTDDYVDILSYMQRPYYEQVPYDVPDNWWLNADYYNVKLDEFMAVLKKAIRNGYTMSIGGDVSEAGKVASADVALVPSFDIPSEFIDENARQFRFSNETTTDDHGIHLVGYLEKDGKDWYLIKDSGSSSRDGKNKGYYFFSEDYVKLKMMDFMVHKEIADELLKKFDK